MRTGCARGCRTGHATCALAAAGLLLMAGFSAAMVPASADAQESGNGAGEVPIGTFTLGTPHDGFSIVEPPAGVLERKRDSGDDGSGRWFFQGWQTAPRQDSFAEGLYENAMEALDNGRTDEAQRLFERLIAEAPRSPRAAAARQHLGQIYRSSGSEPRASSKKTGVPIEAALPWTERSDGPAAGPPDLGVSQAVSRVALYQARVSPSVDGQFLSDAGDRVFFSAGSANLGSRAQGVIQSQARFLIRFPSLFAAVEGYADDGPLSDSESQRLSERRAAAVRARLIAEGVAADRLVAYGRGGEDRVSDCSAPECLAQNRRAVTVLLSRRIEAVPVRRAQGEAPEIPPAPATP